MSETSLARVKQHFFDKWGYEPHSRAQWSYHQSKARFRVAVCGRRFGKSRMAGLDESVQLVLPRPVRGRYISWIVGPTYDLGEKEFRVIWDTLIVEQKFGLDKKVKKAYNKKQGDMYIEFPWNTRVEVRSASHPDTLVGEGLDKIILSEAAKHKKETWEQILRPALSDKRGGADFPTTPEGHNWLYDIWGYGRGQDPLYESWNFPTWLNTVVYPGGEFDPEIVQMRTKMGDEEFGQEIAANFTSFAGKIYGEFNETHHVKKYVFNPAWPNYMFFDFGFANAFAAIECQVDPWDNVYVWREHYKSYLTMPEHIAIMRNREQPSGYRLDGGFGDAADPSATKELSMNMVPTLSMNEAKENWREGIDMVKRFLKLRPVGEDEWGAPIEVPKLIIDPSCTNLIREFNNYKVKAKPRSEELPSDSTKSGTAQKVNDHALDALRYGIMHLFKLGAQWHLKDTIDELNRRGQFDSLDIVTEGSDLWLPSGNQSFFSGDMEF